MADVGKTVVVKWSGKEYSIDLSEENNVITVSCLKKAIELQTGVKVERQKLLNLKFKGTVRPDLHYQNLTFIFLLTNRKTCRGWSQISNT